MSTSNKTFFDYIKVSQSSWVFLAEQSVYKVPSRQRQDTFIYDIRVISQTNRQSIVSNYVGIRTSLSNLKVVSQILILERNIKSIILLEQAPTDPTRQPYRGVRNSPLISSYTRHLDIRYNNLQERRRNVFYIFKLLSKKRQDLAIIVEF